MPTLTRCSNPLCNNPMDNAFARWEEKGGRGRSPKYCGDAECRRTRTASRKRQSRRSHRPLVPRWQSRVGDEATAQRHAVFGLELKVDTFSRREESELKTDPAPDQPRFLARSSQFGYVPYEAVAMPGEAEAVPASYQAHLDAAARERTAERERTQLFPDRSAEPPEELTKFQLMCERLMQRSPYESEGTA